VIRPDDGEAIHCLSERVTVTKHASDPTVPTRRRTALLAWTLALLLPAGVGVAVWSATGSGSGAAKARTAQSLVVTAGSAVGDLYPGASGKVYLSVQNPNPYAVTLTGGSVTAVTGVTGTCPTSDFTLGSGTVPSTSIAAGATADVVLDDALTMKTTALDVCQGVTVTVSATVTGTQS
jgi:hypothetical protein